MHHGDKGVTIASLKDAQACIHQPGLERLEACNEINTMEKILLHPLPVHSLSMHKRMASQLLHGSAMK